jgi:tetratricopeptide (TPR) repeat protein
MTELDNDIYEHIQSLCKIGDNLALKKDFENAINKYKEALKLVPKPYTDWEAATWICVALGEARFFQNDFEKAKKCFSNAILCPDGLGNPFVHLKLGQCEYEIGNMDKAADELTRAYMGAGEEIFEEDNKKYFDFLRTKIIIE